MNTTPDGDYQTYKAEAGAYVREHFFGRDPRTRKMVEHLSDDEIWSLSSAAATTTASCTPPTRRPPSTPASRR